MPKIKLPTLYAIKKNGGILDKWSRANGVSVLSFIYSEQVNLRDIISAEFKTVKFRDCYVFDVQSCKGNDEEFLTCMQSVQFQTDARIVVYAGEHYAGDELLDRLIKCGITNIVAKYDDKDAAENMSLMLADLAECMSDDGLSRKKWRRYEKGYDPTAEARYEEELLKKERAKPSYANANLKIAVVGAQARIGTTSTAIHIADYFAHHRAAAAVISADGLEFSDEQLELFFTYNSLNVVMMTAPIFMLVKKVNIKSPIVQKALANLTLCGFGVYMVHFFFTGPSVVVMRMIGIPLCLQIPCAAVLAFAVSWAIVYLIYRVAGKKAKYIVG